MVKDDQCRPMYAIGKNQDITDRKLMEEILAISKMKPNRLARRRNTRPGNGQSQRSQEPARPPLRNSRRRCPAFARQGKEDHWNHSHGQHPLQESQRNYGHYAATKFSRRLRSAGEKQPQYDFVGRHCGED